LTRGIFISDDPNDITGRLDDALHKVILAEPIERRLRSSHAQKPDLQDYQQWLEQLLEMELVTEEEVKIMQAAKAATRKVIMVDDFTPQELKMTKPGNRSKSQKVA
jgi:acyl-CoA dehydrogenase